VCAVRTGCGKSSTTMKICKILRKYGKKFVVIRHPMPYGDLEKQEVQRFATFEDLDKHNCTIEEREEYEPHILQGNIVYAGVDYQKILRKAEKEAQIIVWDGGNNDFPFYKSDLHIVLADPHRVGHELLYYPGQMNFISADVILINKENTAKRKNIKKIKKHVKEFNPNAIVIDADSEISIKKSIARKRVVIVEDGPTLTHGGMAYGAGYLAAQKHKARIIRPKKWAVGTLKDVFKKYKHLGNIIPAMGYSKEQIKDLEKTLNRVPADIIIDASPVRIQRLVKVNKPIVQVNYSLHETSRTDLERVLKKFKII
jgi:predicted GTPase